MKVIETDGIVLKTMDFKEKDCILTFLTTKGVRKQEFFTVEKV